MNSNLQVFSNQHFKVRIINQDGEPWFIAKDVCDILGYTNVTKALNDHLDEDERNTLTIREGTSPKGGNPNMNIINESGLYALVLRSNMPKAKEFRKWVTGEVLPSIRKTGQYVSSLTVDEFELKRKDLDLRGAQILQSLIDKELFPLTPETRTVFAHEVFRLVTGHNYLAMLPESTEKWFTATDIGKELGISANMVGRIAKREGIKPPEGESNEFGRWIFSKSQYSSREVPSFIYNEYALDWFKNYTPQSA